jgi:3'(2'), 5'-bisphosphate nucleotidase
MNTTIFDDSRIPYQKLLLIALEAALQAGKAIMDIYQTSFEIEYKEDQSPLTLADRLADNIINKLLKETGIPILSEESAILDYTERKSWETLWIVDPLDGTKEFIQRNDEFTVNIALVYKQKPVLGIVYAPAIGEFYFASVHSGAFFVPLKKTTDFILQDIIASAEKIPFDSENTAFIVLGSRSHMNAETTSYINSLKLSHPNLRVQSRGSSLKFCAVADGSCQIYPRFGTTMEWDTAAGQAILEIAGGSITEANSGYPLLYNKESLKNPHFIAKR